MSRPTTVAVLSPVTGGPYFGEILEGITRELGSVGGRVMLLQTLAAGRSRDDLVGTTDFATHTGWDQIDGVIVITGTASRAYLDEQRAAGRPVVLASESIRGFDAPSASPDNVEGIHAAIDHLITHGHQRIGFAANLVQSDMRERHDAYLLALRAHGIEPEPSWLFPASDNGDVGGRGVGDDLIAAGLPVTALVAATDRIAIAVMAVLAKAGVSVPGNLAVVGFDDIERGLFGSPTLSTVSPHFDDVGALAARLVLALLRGEQVGSHAHRQPSTFVARESCGCPVGDQSVVARPDVSSTVALAARLSALLLADTGSADEIELTREVTAFSDAVVQAVAAGRDVPLSIVKGLATVVRRFDPVPEVYTGIVEAVTDHICGLDLGLPTTDSPTGAVLARCAAQVSASLWQARARTYLERNALTEAALDEQFEIGMRLLERDRSDPRWLAWMSGTKVRAGCLGLWDGGPETGLLRIAGVYDPDQVLTGVAGTTVVLEDFPPTRLLAHAPAQEGCLTFVIPVQAQGRDWGLLAVVAEVNATSAGGGQTYDQWAALLASSFEQDALQENIRGSEERYSLVARATNDGLWDWDLVDDSIYYSARCSELLGRRQPAGSDAPMLWFDAVHPDDLDPLRQILAEAARGERRPVEFEHRVRGVDGRYHHVLCRALPVGPAGGPAQRMVGSLSDIDPRKELEEQLRRTALYDEVTGLPNRKLFTERLTSAIAHEHRAPQPRYAVLFLDLDGFKLVNDKFGHLVGDRLLAEVGERLLAGLREVDMAARFGGDEFAVLLYDADLGAVREVVERIQIALAQPMELDGNEVVVTASVGITTSEGGYDFAEDVLRDADIAMYQAKSHERGSSAFFEAGMQVVAAAQLGLQYDLRQALGRKQLEVYYQPIIDLDTNRINRLEAHVRWRHPELGLIEAPGFLTLLEVGGPVLEVGRWLLEEVCRQLAEWQETSVVSGAKVSVNVSELEFWDPSFLPHLRDCLERFQIAPDRLILEVDESVMVGKFELAQKMMRDLRDTGVELHIDNVGASHSSFHALRRFPVQALKIDGALVRGLATDPWTESIVKMILTVGQTLGIDVVADGVDTKEQLDRLRDMGCRTAQGQWLAEIVDAHAATDALSNGRSRGSVSPVRRDG